MENNNYYVYLHLFPNKKRYYGITYQEPETRWANGKGYMEQYVYYAIKEFGWDNIEHKIIAKGLTEQQASIMERYLILKWKSNNEKYGYNCSYGGEITNGESISKRKKQLAEQGKWIGNVLPLGYTINENKEIVVNEQEKAIVIDMFNKYLATNSKATKQWLLDTYNIKVCRVIDMLQNKHYIGYPYSQENTKDLYFKDLQIIPLELWEQVQQAIKDRRTNGETLTFKTPFLLESIVYHSCGNKLYISHDIKNGKRYSYYRCNCKDNGKKNFSIEKTDKIINNIIIEKFGKDYELLNQLEKKLFIRNVVEKVILNSWEDIQIIYK